MSRVTPYPPDLFAPGRRHLVIFAHQDDELPNAGLIAQMGSHIRVIWVTNGDGLAPRAKMNATKYAELRRQESIAAMARLGVGTDALRFLGHSELAIYDDLARLSHDARPDAPVPDDYPRMASQVVDEARAFRPDVLWTQAWQGGHPEHDLAHLFAATARNALAPDTGERPPLYELPAYELTFLVPLRFAPWHRGVQHQLRLDDETLSLKREMMDCYPTQDFIIEGFRRLITLYGRLSALRGRPFSFLAYARREVFAPVPADRDYGASTHGTEWLDYMFDRHLDTPIRFGRTLPRIARALGLS